MGMQVAELKEVHRVYLNPKNFARKIHCIVHTCTSKYTIYIQTHKVRCPSVPTGNRANPLGHALISYDTL